MPVAIAHLQRGSSPDQLQVRRLDSSLFTQYWLPVKYGDIDGDGIVGIGDFLAIIGLWGACQDQCCLADLDLDGVVGIGDFLIVLGNWD